MRLWGWGRGGGVEGGQCRGADGQRGAGRPEEAGLAGGWTLSLPGRGCTAGLRGMTPTAQSLLDGEMEKGSGVVHGSGVACHPVKLLSRNMVFI